MWEGDKDEKPLMPHGKEKSGCEGGKRKEAAKAAGQNGKKFQRR